MKRDNNFIYQSLVKPLAFKMDPEKVHNLVVNSVHYLYWFPGLSQMIRLIFGYEHPMLQSQFLGHVFPNPIGMAAGFDKDGLIYNSLFDLGFGFVEIGTVTPLPQPGNEKPRLFRLIEDQAIINRMGFNNFGLEKLTNKLKKCSPKGVLGINIGKNKVTSIENAIDDYEKCLESVYNYSGYIAINVSSPNTESLRQLQEKDVLCNLLERVLNHREKKNIENKKKVPILLKIAPDLSQDSLADIVDVIKQFPVDGVIATNTTIERNNLKSCLKEETGGLSGKPLLSRSNEIIRFIYRENGNKCPIIGVGGIFNAEDAYEKFISGASLIQIYTALIYQGPSIVKQIKKGLVDLLKKNGYHTLNEAIGSGLK